MRSLEDVSMELPSLLVIPTQCLRCTRTFALAPACRVLTTHFTYYFVIQGIIPPPFPFDPSAPQIYPHYGPSETLPGQQSDFYGPYGEPDLPTPSSPRPGLLLDGSHHDQSFQQAYVEPPYDLPQPGASSSRSKAPRRKVKRVKQPLPICSFCFGSNEQNRDGVPEDLLTCCNCKRSGKFTSLPSGGSSSTESCSVEVQGIPDAYKSRTWLMQSERTTGDVKNARLVKCAAEKITR